MSFRCEFCHKAMPQKTSPEIVIVKHREKEYTNEAGEIVGKGWEIVKEAHVCKKCAEPKKKEE